MVNSTLIVIAVILVLMIVYISYNDPSKEGMISLSGAPLNYSTFDPQIPYGKFDAGSFESNDCSVGNCPLGTTVTDDRYCGIQCAQEVDKDDRMKCYAQCMEMMKSCS